MVGLSEQAVDLLNSRAVIVVGVVATNLVRGRHLRKARMALTHKAKAAIASGRTNVEQRIKKSLSLPATISCLEPCHRSRMLLIGEEFNLALS